MNSDVTLGSGVLYVGHGGKMMKLGDVQDFKVNVKTEVKGEQEEERPQHTGVTQVCGTCSVELSEKYNLFSMGKKTRFDKQDRKGIERLLKKGKRS